MALPKQAAVNDANISASQYALMRDFGKKVVVLCAHCSRNTACGTKPVIVKEVAGQFGLRSGFGCTTTL